MTQAPGKNRRDGTTMVETALALPICLLLLLGVFEYGRYVMMRNLLANAAREGARFAVVHTNDRATSDVQNVVQNYLGSQQFQLQKLNIQVNATDASGNIITSGSWTDVSFGSGIGVQIDGDYRPAVPAFLFMPTMTHLQAVAIMSSEAN